MRRIGLDLINEKQSAIGQHPTGVETVNTPEKGKGSGVNLDAHIPQRETETSHGRDLLSILSKSSSILS